MKCSSTRDSIRSDFSAASSETLSSTYSSPPSHVNKREYLLAHIRHKDQIIGSLLKHLHNPYMATPLSIDQFKLAISPSDKDNVRVVDWMDRLQSNTHQPGKASAAKMEIIREMRCSGQVPSSGAGDRSSASHAMGDSDEAVEVSENARNALPDITVPIGLLANLSLDKDNKKEKGKGKSRGRLGSGTGTSGAAIKPEEDDDTVDYDVYGVLGPGPANDFDIRKHLIERNSPPDILHGLVTSADVDKLFDMCSFIGLLDSRLHTSSSIFQRGPFLFTSAQSHPGIIAKNLKSDIYPVAMHFAKHSGANALIDGWKSVELYSYIRKDGQGLGLRECLSRTPPIGALVEITAGKGIVYFCGTTSFAPGKWVGIELFKLKGKNDGSIQGIGYFSCRPLYGVFIRPSQVKIIAAEPEQSPVNVSFAFFDLMQSQSSRLLTFSERRVLQLTISTLPVPASFGPVYYALVQQVLRLPPARPAQSNPHRRGLLCSHHQAGRVLYISSCTTILPRETYSITHPPITQVLLHQSTIDNVPPSPSKPATCITAPSVSTLSSSQLDKTSIIVPSSRTTVLSPSAPLTSSPQPRLQPLQQSPVLEPASLLSPAQITLSSSLMGVPVSATPSLTNKSGHVRTVSITREPSSPITTRTVEDAELQELRARIRVMEAKQGDDAHQIRELETRLSEAESFLAQPSDNRGIDTQEQSEMAMLDKEVAEEKAELAQALAELEEVREKLAQMEVELQVLKDGCNQGPVTTLIKLSNAKMQIDDPTAQLDDALGAEEMLVELTERNLMLGEKSEEMRITIENLEAFKELNDELEENHIETEKALQEEIGVHHDIVRWEWQT
ncbi:hypothetical protein JVT61DRAFT_12607 [Boletus reticuloceps]|uniref:CAP-Gly domain-containing protein n=1 Tax=Boletus reticuloceps TaxID=495285 RepID=A0A8I2YDS3_9AGAM|nr:hypothetical protein JVT61DRAFT_12607 [Boletus reticuloceps]